MGASLEIVESRDSSQVGQSVTIPTEGDEIVLGRSPDCQVVIPSSTVSRQHARLEWEASSIKLTDLGSANGTFVNGQRIHEPAVIGDGDTVAFGSLTVRLHVQGASTDEDEEDAEVETVAVPELQAAQLAAEAKRTTMMDTPSPDRDVPVEGDFDSTAQVAPEPEPPPAPEEPRAAAPPPPPTPPAEPPPAEAVETMLAPPDPPAEEVETKLAPPEEPSAPTGPVRPPPAEPLTASTPFPAQAPMSSRPASSGDPSVGELVLVAGVSYAVAVGLGVAYLYFAA